MVSIQFVFMNCLYIHVIYSICIRFDNHYLNEIAFCKINKNTHEKDVEWYLLSSPISSFSILKKK